MGHFIQVQEAVIKKVLLGNKRRHEIAKECGVGRSTIGKLLKEYQQKGSMRLLTILPPIFAIASDVPFKVAILGNGKSATLWHKQSNFGYHSERG